MTDWVLLLEWVFDCGSTTYMPELFIIIVIVFKIQIFRYFDKFVRLFW